MYEAFFKGYTTKQWGLSPRDIPATILKRLPIRFTYDDNYFDHQFQGIPRDGYTAVIARLLNNPNIHVHLNALFFRTLVTHYGHVFYSGPLDEWYSHKLGRLPYRTLDFKVRRGIGDAQGAPIINYCDEEVPYTRITEHKHFAPWEAHEKTITFEEHSRASEPYDEPFYPIHLVSEQDMLIKYTELARQETNVTFVGRLGTYRYIDMDVAVSEALTVSGKFNT
jgi:UDP-galactopyranose mutase